MRHLIVRRTSQGGGGGGGSTPSWWPSLAEFPNWTRIAQGTGTGFQSGTRLHSVFNSPGCTNPNGGWGSEYGTVDGYTGAYLDQINKEYGYAAGGGHGDGANNSVFALSLQTEIPFWRRLTDSTPDANLGDLNTDFNFGKFDDGRPRSMHASNQCWAGGAGITNRVWYSMQSSVTSGSGGHADNVLTFEREALGAALTPLTWTGANIGPWTFRGSSGQNTNVYGFGGMVFDDVSNKLIAFANASGSFGAFWQVIPLTGGSANISQAYSNGSINCDVTWMAACPDLGIVVVGDANNGSSPGRVIVYTVGTNTVAAPTQSTTNIYTPHHAGCYVGAQYVPASRTIVLCDPWATGSTYYVLHIPVSGSSYNAGGTWTWTTGTWSGGPDTTRDTTLDYNRNASSSSNFVSTKFLTLKDMGDGRSAFVFGTGTSADTFISKIPTGGVT